ncbi:hypothetical protein Tco_1431294 [Tanacetum coccineum]
MELDTEALQLKTCADVQAFLLFDDDMAQESDDDVPDLKKFDNILPLTERQLATIEGYYEENIDHMEQTNKVIDAAMNSLDKNNIAMGDLLIALNRVNESLNAIQDAVKENLTLHKKSFMASLQATATSQEKHLAELAKSSTSIAWNLGSRMIAIELSQATIQTEVSSQARHFGYQIHDDKDLSWENVKQADTEEPPSHTEGEHVVMEEEPTNTVLIITVKPTKIPTPEVQPITTIISISQHEPSVPQREGKAFVTDDQPEV